MNPDLQKRIQRYGWDKAARYYEDSWKEQLNPAHEALLQLAATQPGEHILDIAAGTGLVSFRLAAMAGPTGKLLATDISEGMINIADSDISNVSFKRMDAENLDCPTSAFHLVSCALGLMYFPNPQTSLEEMYRVLRPEGRAIVAVWGSRKKCGWSEIFPIVDSRVKTDVCPMFFNLGEGDTLKYSLKKAGFKNVSILKLSVTLKYISAQEVCDASFIGGPVAMAYSRFDEVTKQEARKAYVKSISIYKTKSGYEIPGEFVIGMGNK